MTSRHRRQSRDTRIGKDLIEQQVDTCLTALPLALTGAVADGKVAALSSRSRQALEGHILASSVGNGHNRGIGAQSVGSGKLHRRPADLHDRKWLARLVRLANALPGQRSFLRTRNRLRYDARNRRHLMQKLLDRSPQRRPLWPIQSLTRWSRGTPSLSSSA